LLNPGIGFVKILKSEGIRIRPGMIAKFRTTCVLADVIS
jgi:hypothetical protein